MTSKINTLFILSFLLLNLNSCKTLQIEKPNESYLPANLAPAISEIPLLVEVDVKKLETAVNARMVGLIFEDANVSNKDLSVKVWKAQNFSFTVKDNVIEYRVPLKIWTRFAWKIEKFGFSVGDFYEATGTIALTYKTTIAIDKNWKLVSNTSSSGFQWIETPKLNVIGVNVPLTPIANMVLSQSEKIISEQIDNALINAIDLKQYVSQAWMEIQKPRQISAENNAWIRITPKDVYVSPFSTVGNKLSIAMSMYAQIESFVGSKPSANSKVALPPFKIVNRPPNDFNLNIAGDVTFAKILEMAKVQLLNKSFSEGNKSITIIDLSIFGNEGRAVFVADVTGSLKGRIYFNGKMEYNPEKMAVEITDPQFDVKTSNALLKSASWLLKGVILKQLTPYLTYPVKQDLEQMKLHANQMLSNYSIMDGILLQGKLTGLNVTNLILVPGAVRIQANVKGNVALKVADLKF